MRRKSLLLLVGAAAALAVACRDAVSPTRSASPFSSSASPEFSKSGTNSNRTELGTLELSPNGGTYHVGDFDIVVPAGAVCDPATTNYGVKHWDDDCAPAQHSITVNVVAKKHAKGVSVDFQPDLRFRPSAGWVTIQTSAYNALLTSNSVRQLSSNSSFFQSFAILYVPTGGASHIDEVRSTGDASMVTHVDLRTGIVWRRVKHFSGYLITAGYSCASVGPDGTCNVDDPTNIVAPPLVQASTFGIAFIDSTALAASVIVDP
ncbi:MAG TPA: hypothetical protein VFD67_07495 [Gemmatimonadaceae bacterium]|nr:hypothetical protein [Gemmatimonadaceae bacterium]